MIRNFAHRGFSENYPENTMLAFEKAIEAGADGIELDVQLTKDGVPVILHDEALFRTTGAPGYVWDYDWAELAHLDASRGNADFLRLAEGSAESAADPAARGQVGDPAKLRIPMLEEYLALAAESGIMTNIELKTSVNPYPGIEEKVLALVDAYGQRKSVILSSFNHYSIVRVKKLASEIPCGLLTESWLVGAAGYANRLGAEYLHPYYPSVTEEFVQEAKEKGVGINTWTVNEEPQIRRLAALGVEGLIGNHPGRIKRVLGV